MTSKLILLITFLNEPELFKRFQELLYNSSNLTSVICTYFKDIDIWFVSE